MRRFVRSVGLAAVFVAIVAGAYLGLTLPPRAVAVSTPRPAGTVYGAYHVHSSRSDGSGTVDEIAAAAARAGLAFVIFTDHGDATRAPDPPAYRHGVLCIDAVEVSTAGGHVVALNLPRPADYPLGGETRDVIEDVHRMGGWAVAAHPDSPRAELRWRADMGEVDGIEWLNVDSEWRDETPTRLITTLGRAFIRPAESIAALFDRPARSLARWDAAASGRLVAGLVAADAHARIGWRDDAEPRGARGWAFPGYEAVFRAVALAVDLGAPLLGQADGDAPRLIRAVTAGRVYSVVRAFADPGVLEFAGETSSGQAVHAGALVDEPGVRLRAQATGAPEATLVLLRNGQQVATGKGSLTADADRGVYRVEAFYPGFAAPWMVSNPIRVGPVPVAPAGAPVPPPPARFMAIGASAGWRIEQDPSSAGTVEASADEIRFEFRLGPGRPASQYAALVTSASGDAPVERIRFTGRADRPMRLSLQVRVPGGADGRRWRRSVYLDSTPRTIDVRLGELDPVGPATALRPIVARVQSVLFVVDTVNALPGSGGTVRISGVTLGLGQPGG